MDEMSIEDSWSSNLKADLKRILVLVKSQIKVDPEFWFGIGFTYRLQEQWVFCMETETLWIQTIDETVLMHSMQNRWSKSNANTF